MAKIDYGNKRVLGVFISPSMSSNAYACFFFNASFYYVILSPISQCSLQIINSSANKFKNYVDCSRPDPFG